MSYQEPSACVIHGMAFEATKAQQRAVRVALVRSAPWQRWHQLDTVARMHHLCAETAEGFDRQLASAQDLAAKLAEADAAMTAELAKIIDRLVID